VGERGVLVADFASSTLTLHASEHRRRGEAWEVVDEGKEELAAAGLEPLRLEIEAFLAACRSGGPSPVPADAGLRALQIVEAASRSARLERTVAIAEIR
jgi:predicted dehydrogenase